jgi:hypothetical protein
MRRTRCQPKTAPGHRHPNEPGQGVYGRTRTGCARGLDARARSRCPPAVVLGYLGALLAYGQDNRYGTGADGLEFCGCRLLEAASRRL